MNTNVHRAECDRKKKYCLCDLETAKHEGFEEGKAGHEKDKKSGSICPHGNEKGLCRVCPSISISELNKIVKRSKEQDRQALLEKIDELYKKHKKCNPAGFLCLEQFVDEIKQSVGTEKDANIKRMEYDSVLDSNCPSSEIPTLSEKIDKAVDEWCEESGLTLQFKDDGIEEFLKEIIEELKQKLKEAVR